MIIKIIINEITNLKGYKMNKDKKIQDIIEELECSENTARQIYEISEDIDTDNYSYCEVMLKISEKIGSYDYNYCEKIYEISEDIDNEDYSYCEDVYKVYEKIGNDDYPYCEEILDISNGMTPKY